MLVAELQLIMVKGDRVIIKYIRGIGNPIPYIYIYIYIQ